MPRGWESGVEVFEERHEDYSKIKPFSFNPNHLDRPSGEWETKAKKPLKRVLSWNCFSKGHVGCVIGRDQTFAGHSNPARLRPGRLGCRSSDLRHFPRDIRIIFIWILFKHLSLSCWSIHSRTLVSHARRQQRFIWFGLSFCNCEEAEDWRGWTDVGSISVYSEFNPPDPCGHDWLWVGHVVGTLAIQAAWWEDGSDIMTQHLGAGGHMNAESSWPSIIIYNVCASMWHCQEELLQVMWEQYSESISGHDVYSPAVRRPREETGHKPSNQKQKGNHPEAFLTGGLRTGWWFYDNWPFFDNNCSGVGEKTEWHVDLEQKIIENSCINETRNICFNCEMIFVPWPVLPMRGSINCCFCEPSGAWSLKLFCAPKSMSSYSTTSSLLL